MNFAFKVRTDTRIFMKNIPHLAYSSNILLCILNKNNEKLLKLQTKINKNNLNKIEPNQFYSLLQEYSNKRTRCFLLFLKMLTRNCDAMLSVFQKKQELLS